MSLLPTLELLWCQAVRFVMLAVPVHICLRAVLGDLYSLAIEKYSCAPVVSSFDVCGGQDAAVEEGMWRCSCPSRLWKPEAEFSAIANCLGVLWPGRKVSFIYWNVPMLIFKRSKFINLRDLYHCRPSGHQLLTRTSTLVSFLAKGDRLWIHFWRPRLSSWAIHPSTTGRSGPVQTNYPRAMFLGPAIMIGDDRNNIMGSFPSLSRSIFGLVPFCGQKNLSFSLSQMATASSLVVFNMYHACLQGSWWPWCTRWLTASTDRPPQPADRGHVTEKMTLRVLRSTVHYENTFVCLADKSW